jgi:predicted choloylglycine hydrolase
MQGKLLSQKSRPRGPCVSLVIGINLEGCEKVEVSAELPFKVKGVPMDTKQLLNILDKFTESGIEELRFKDESSEVVLKKSQKVTAIAGAAPCRCPYSLA